MHLQGPEACQHPEQAGLPAPVGPHNHAALTWGHLKGQLPHKPGAVWRVQGHPAVNHPVWSVLRAEQGSWVSFSRSKVSTFFAAVYCNPPLVLILCPASIWTQIGNSIMSINLFSPP